MMTDQDSAKVQVPPPFVLLGSILVGVGLHLFFPLHFIVQFRWVFAGLLMCVGLGTVSYCVWMFRKAQTAIQPWKATSRIVTSGPYRWSRNPIYLSFVLIGIGLAWALDNLWILMMQIPVIIVINHFVIRKEERYLVEKFGERYKAYKARVRRWI